MTHLELGQAGENLAVGHLTRLGYKIVERNFKWNRGEIDFICIDQDTMVIVEVKTRQTDAFGEPFNAVSRKKQKQIISVANHYVQHNNIDLEVRFDIVSIVHNRFQTIIDHIPSAFIPTL